MSRNDQSHFALNPRINIGRSAFDRSHSVKLSFNVGDVIPFYVDEVLPGDTFDIRTSKVVRLQSMMTPIMDNMYLDTYYFFVPNRLVWEHWQEFCGENRDSAWIPKVEYTVPQLLIPPGGMEVGTIADYMGIPTGVGPLSVNALPFRAYALIMDEWFRDENLTDPLDIPVGDAATYATSDGGYITATARGGPPFKAAKYHDYFTSCLPSPQKGPDVLIPIGSAQSPVVPLDEMVPASFFGGHSMKVGTPSGGEWKGGEKSFSINDAVGSQRGEIGTVQQSYSPDYGSAYDPVFRNLWAISDTATAASINQLRMAFAVQKLYEKDARGGTRYIEILKSHFGVTSPDARLQRPEYLGGNRIPININQVLQQSGTMAEGTPQGTPTGQSLTTDQHRDFRKSFVEHGFVIGLMVARYPHTYQQGVERFWSRTTRFDYYWPVFQNLGEQAVLNKEIYAQGTPVDDEVFGYNEAWADYRYKPNRVAGEMRSKAAQSLDVWHLGDDYDALPRLSDSWIREDGDTVDRVLAVSQRTANQLFADIYIQNRSVRPMPIYSIPGLIDRN